MSLGLFAEGKVLPRWAPRDGLQRRFDEDGALARMAQEISRIEEPDVLLVLLTGIDRVSRRGPGRRAARRSSSSRHPPSRTAAGARARDRTTSFDASERQVVLLTTSFENNCEYCMAAHTAIAGQQGVPADVIESLRSASPLASSKLEALRKFTAIVVQSRGLPGTQDLQNFAAAGYTQTQVLEVILGVTIKTLSNYVNHVAQTPVDAAFKPVEWKKAA